VESVHFTNRAPWVVDRELHGDNEEGPMLRIRTDEKHRLSFIAQVSTWHLDEAPDAKKEAEANARLIAAAPDLFALVHRIIDGEALSAELLEDARKAYAKTQPPTVWASPL
jgi:hypothetical protein